jgi:hypothetical protein
MSPDRVFEFTKENIDTYLKAVAKEYRKISGKEIPAELILIGGASVLINYGFRNMTTDIDALIMAASSMKEAINIVGDRYDLPNGWLNADFENTSSFTPNLVQYSEYYRTYSNVVSIRTVSAEYLIAMKLRSGRQYKNDLSDILGILAEHEKRNDPLNLEQIKEAFNDLYGSWDLISDNSRIFIENVMINGNFEDQYKKVVLEEHENDILLTNFELNYPNTVKTANVDDILSLIKNGIIQMKK